MKRFNLLLVNGEGMLGEQILKTLAKVYKNNFVFQVNSLQEAEKLLGKLHIDVALIDLDRFNVSLEDYTREFEGTIFMGSHSTRSTVASILNPFKNKIYRKDALLTELYVDLKAMKKAPADYRKKAPAPARTPNFRDYFKLVPG